MTREESIQFIDKCIEEMKSIPINKLDEYRQAYKVGTSVGVNSDFVFLMPSIEVGYNMNYRNIVSHDAEDTCQCVYKYENAVNINVINRNIAKAA